MEGEALVIGCYLCDEFLKLLHCPLVNSGHLGIVNAVPARVEIADITQQVSQGVPDFAVSVLCSSYQLVVTANILLIIHAGDPEAKNIGAVFGDLILGIYIIAQRLGLFHSFFIHGKAVRQYSLERFGANRAESGQ